MCQASWIQGWIAWGWFEFGSDADIWTGIFFNCGIVYLQSCLNFRCTAPWSSYTHTHTHTHTHTLQNIEYNSLCYTVGSHCLLTLYTVGFFLIEFFFISWRLITLQYCSGFCHTLTWISHGYICIPHPNPPSHLSLHPIPLGLPSAPGPSTCLMHPTWLDVHSSFVC